MPILILCNFGIWCNQKAFKLYQAKLYRDGDGCSNRYKNRDGNSLKFKGGFECRDVPKYPIGDGKRKCLEASEQHSCQAWHILRTVSLFSFD